MLIETLDYLCFNILMIFSYQMFYSAVLFIPVLCACYLLRGKYTYLKFVLWSLVLLRLALPPNFSLPFSIREVFEGYSLDLFNYAVVLIRLSAMGFMDVSTPVSERLPFITWYILIIGIWLSTSALLLLRFCRNRQQYSRLLQQSDPVTDPQLLQQLAQWRSAFQIRRPVQLLTSDTMLSPFTLGIFRPRIYLPRDLIQQVDLCAISAVLGHECAHIKRFDDFWLRIQALIGIMFFFYPVVWFVNRQIDKQRELICDQLAVTRWYVPAADYAEGMVAVLMHYKKYQGHKSHVLAWPQKKHFYNQRIKVIAGASVTGLRGIGLSLCVLLIALLFVLPMAPSAESEQRIFNELEHSTRAILPTPSVFLPSPITNGRLLFSYGARPPSLKLLGRSEFHYGVDIAAPENTPIRAIAPGVVIRSVDGASEAFANRDLIIIQHDNDIIVHYSGVARQRVKNGQRVASGEQLGVLGSFAFSRSNPTPHLHLTVIYRGVSIDPATLIDLPPS